MPLTKLLLCLLTGFLLAYYIPSLSINIVIALAIVVFAILLFVKFLPVHIQFQVRKYQTIAVYVVLILLAILLYYFHNVRHQKKWFGNYLAANAIVEFQVIEPPTISSKSVKLIGTVPQVWHQTNYPISTTGKLLAYVEISEKSLTIKAGNSLLISAKNIKPIENIGNPGGFDYERYASFKNIFHQSSFLYDSLYALLPYSHLSKLKQIVFAAREHTINTLQKFIDSDKNIIGIAEALLIGYKQDLDKNQVQVYTNTGTVHIIAISGLHIGILYWILEKFFQLFKLLRTNKTLRLVLLISTLAFFTLLTGASASVLRSVVMFSVMLIGKTYFGKTSLYQSLILSAVLLLLGNPYLLWDVGFQLSYAAVMGIILFYPIFFRYVQTKNKVLNFITGSIAISLAAQLGTLPITLFYFHQFPIWFLATNLIAVPLSTLILIIELLLIIVSSIEPVANIIGICISALIKFMNNVIQFFNDLPYNNIVNIHIHLAEAILLGFGISFLYNVLTTRSKKWLYALYLCVLIEGIFISVDVFFASQQKQIVVYNIPKYTTIDFIKGQQFASHQTITNDTSQWMYNFFIAPTRNYYYLKDEEKNLVQQINMDWYLFEHTSIFIPSKKYQFSQTSQPINIDMLLLTKNFANNLQEVLRYIKPNLVVIDNSVSAWKSKQLISQCKNLEMPYFCTRENGAYTHALK